MKRRKRRKTLLRRGAPGAASSASSSSAAAAATVACAPPSPRGPLFLFLLLPPPPPLLPLLLGQPHVLVDQALPSQLPLRLPVPALRRVPQPRRPQRGRERRRHGVALEVDVDLAVPAPPRLGRREHAAAAAHVAERALAGAVGPAAGDARDPGDGAARSPGLGGGLHAGRVGDGVGLAGVLGEAGVDLEKGFFFFVLVFGCRCCEV